MLRFKQNETIRIQGVSYHVESVDNDLNQATLKSDDGTVKRAQFNPDAEYPYNGIAKFIE